MIMRYNGTVGSVRPVKVSLRLKRNAAAIIALNNASDALKHAILAAASKELVLSLVECARNIISGKVQLSPDQFSALAGYSKAIRSLTAPSYTIAAKKRILQKGGFLGLLLKPLLGALGGIIGGVTGRR